jgi:hypothetical protein
LLDKPDPLATPKLNDPAQELARTRTVLVLRRLDPTRRADILHFLSDERLLLISTQAFSIEDNNALLKVLGVTDWRRRTQRLTPVIRLYGADFTGAAVPDIGLHDANLARVTLNQVVLRGANLRRAILCSSQLEGAALEGADLRGAVLYHIDLKGAHLEGANLKDAYADPTAFGSAQVDPQALTKLKHLDRADHAKLGFLGC